MAVVIPQAQHLARIDAQSLIAQAIAAGAGIDTMERLVALAKDLREVQAREAWYGAMAEFQRTCPPIRKTSQARIATRSGGGYTYRFAALDEIMSAVTPILTALGLSVSWRSTVKSTSVVVICRVAHSLGHVEDGGEVEMPVMPGDTGANPAQRVGISLTYARRYALMNALGLAPEDDDDAGTPPAARESHGGEVPQADPPGAAAPVEAITEAQVKRFWAIAREQGWQQDDVRDLLTSFGVEHTKEIPRARYEAVINRLKAEKKTPPSTAA